MLWGKREKESKGSQKFQPRCFTFELHKCINTYMGGSVPDDAISFPHSHPKDKPAWKTMWVTPAQVALVPPLQLDRQKFLPFTIRDVCRERQKCHLMMEALSPVLCTSLFNLPADVSSLILMVLVGYMGGDSPHRECNPRTIHALKLSR